MSFLLTPPYFFFSFLSSFFFFNLRHPYSITTMVRLDYCTAMHQRVHSAVLDKEHHIYNSIYIWFFFFKENSRPRRKKKKINIAFLFFSFAVPCGQLKASQVWNFKKWKCFCTDSCNTRYSLLPMPLKNFPILLFPVFPLFVSRSFPLKLEVVSFSTYTRVCIAPTHTHFLWLVRPDKDPPPTPRSTFSNSRSLEHNVQV